MKQNWSGIFAFTLAQEGGYSNDPNDPGGVTNLGITRETLSGWLGQSASVAQVKALTTASVQPIYTAMYWKTVNGDELCDGVDLMTFDMGVNAGIHTSSKQLQKAVGVVQDGHIGPLTLAAITKLDPAQVVDEMATAQEIYYRGRANYAIYGAGWIARLVRRVDAAKKLIANTQA